MPDWDLKILPLRAVRGALRWVESILGGDGGYDHATERARVDSQSDVPGEPVAPLADHGVARGSRGVGGPDSLDEAASRLRDGLPAHWVERVRYAAPELLRGIRTVRISQTPTVPPAREQPQDVPVPDNPSTQPASWPAPPAAVALPGEPARPSGARAEGLPAVLLEPVQANPRVESPRVSRTVPTSSGDFAAEQGRRPSISQPHATGAQAMRTDVAGALHQPARVASCDASAVSERTESTAAASGEREHFGVIQYSAYAAPEPSESRRPWSQHEQMPPEHSPARRGTSEPEPSSPESRRDAKPFERLAEHPYTSALLTGKPVPPRWAHAPIEDRGARRDAPAAANTVAESSLPPPNHWPELLEGPVDSTGELMAALRARERLDRLDREQRGE